MLSPEETKEDWGIYPPTSTPPPLSLELRQEWYLHACCAGKRDWDAWGENCHCPRDSLGCRKSRENALTLHPVLLALRSCVHCSALLHSLCYPASQSESCIFLPNTHTPPAQGNVFSRLYRKLRVTEPEKPQITLHWLLASLFSIGLWKPSMSLQGFSLDPFSP